MNIRRFLLFSFLLIPSICFADALLDITVYIDGVDFVIEDATVTTENATLFDGAGYPKVEGRVITQDAGGADVELTVSEGGTVIAQPTLSLTWSTPETSQTDYVSTICPCLHRKVVLVVTAEEVV